MIKHRIPSVEAGLMVVLLVVSMFSFAFVFEDGSFDEITGNFVGVTGEMVKVTGMAEITTLKLVENKLKAGSKVYSYGSPRKYYDSKPASGSGFTGEFEELSLNGDWSSGKINGKVYDVDSAGATPTLKGTGIIDANAVFTSDSNHDESVPLNKKVETWGAFASNSGTYTPSVGSTSTTTLGPPSNARLVTNFETTNGKKVYFDGTDYYQEGSNVAIDSSKIKSTTSTRTGTTTPTTPEMKIQGDFIMVLDEKGQWKGFSRTDSVQISAANRELDRAQNAAGVSRTEPRPDEVVSMTEAYYIDESGVRTPTTLAELDQKVNEAKQKYSSMTRLVPDARSNSDGQLQVPVKVDGVTITYDVKVNPGGNVYLAPPGTTTESYYVNEKGKLQQTDSINKLIKTYRLDKTEGYVLELVEVDLSKNPDLNPNLNTMTEYNRLWDEIRGRETDTAHQNQLTTLQGELTAAMTRDARGSTTSTKRAVEAAKKRIQDFQDNKRVADASTAELFNLITSNTESDSVKAAAQRRLDSFRTDADMVEEVASLGMPVSNELLREWAAQGGTTDIDVNFAYRYLDSDLTLDASLKATMQDLEELKNAGITNLPVIKKVDGGGYGLWDSTKTKFIKSLDSGGLISRTGSTALYRYDSTRILSQEGGGVSGLLQNVLSYHENGVAIYHVDDDGQIVDSKGNVYGVASSINDLTLIPQTGGTYKIDDSHKQPPLERLGLSELEGYDYSGGKVYMRGGVLYSVNTDWGASDWEDNYIADGQKISNTYNINKNEDGTYDSDSTRIKEYFVVEGGRRTTARDTVAIVKGSNEYHIDQATLAMINKYEGSGGGTDVNPRDDGTGVSIDIKNSAGNVVSNIFFLGYNAGSLQNVEGGLLTGTRGQTDFEYTKDVNGNPLAKTTRFFSVTQNKGESSVVTSATDFRTSTDGNTYYVGLIQLGYNSKGEPVESYSYVEANEWSQDIRFGTLLRADGSMIIIATTGIVVTADNELFRNGMEVTNPTEKQKYIDIKNNRKAQYSSRQWFADWEFKLTQYTGLSGFSQFLISDETLAEWRENVDEAFSTAYLGSEYWVSAICAKHIPKDPEGTFMMQTSDGLFDIIAHVEGEVSEPVEYPDGTVHYVYKLTYSVRNPEGSGRELDFNVYLYGEERDVQLYSENKVVDEGESVSRGVGNYEDGQASFDDQNKKPIVDDSTFVYDTICIRFSSEIPDAEGEGQDETCNKIVTYSGSATGYSADGSESGSGGETVVGGDDGEEADI